MKHIYDYLLARYGQKDAQPNLYMMIDELNKKIEFLEEKYQGALNDIKRLEEENISTTNELYRLENSLDSRIDILAEQCGCIKDV